MYLVMIGLNHKTASVEIREKFAFSGDVLVPAMKELQTYPSVRENVIVSTCNRLELWAIVTEADAGQEDLFEFLQSFQAVRLNPSEKDEYFYKYRGHEAVEHLFKVACGLDSLVLGEGQILGQLKEFYESSCAASTNGLFLNSLFKKAINVGKKVRRTTTIGSNANSVSTVAVDLAKKFLGSLVEQKVLVLGAGEMGELTAKSLAVRGVKSIIVANRNFDKAVTLSKECSGEAIHFEEKEKYFAEIDIVISSTSAPHYVVLPEQITEAMKARQGKKMVFIDIAVPRDIDPEIAKIPGVALYDIDDLKIVLEDNLKHRQEEANKALLLIQDEIEDLKNWVKVNPVLALLRQKIERLRLRELDHALENKFTDLTEENEVAADKLTQEIVNKMVDLPISAIMKGKEDKDALIRSLIVLFHLSESEVQDQQLEL